ncbi:MAG: carboxypeptidase regulatory-like domain-containing protein [Pyrinomonadaceae bacterium]|nr:carboxypeptidase regulatory-like domain-containing protein [Pyrinomonadaceae bacterium]MCX7639906.1 carboxypeptidase regulatory-like domain-containing protein [Pyrinomonadaceae bacterium]MDW8304078.1 carboxypeptidase regulatory-like domain-containing protein [Acidobacteriota bacterium]
MKLLLIFAILALFYESNAYSSSIQGFVSDSNNSPIPGATVRLKDQGSNRTLTTQTDREGFYVFTSLEAGNYRIEVTKEGFRSVIRESIVLNVSSKIRLDFTLEPGQINEMVIVEETSRDMVETDSAAVSTLVDRKFIENLPLNGRSFHSLIELTPGVVLVPSSIQSPGQFSINGQRSNANYFTVDGVSANVDTSTNFQFYQQAAGTLPGLSVFGGTSSLASIDTIEEFRVTTSSYEAQYGRQPGGQIEVVTRRGTNKFTFTAFNYLRNDIFDANDFFNNLAGRPKGKLRQNDFGFVAGGPLVLPYLYNGKDRTFFFASYEGLRLTQPQPGSFIANVPSNALRQTAPEPFRTILRAFPLPNAPRQPSDPSDTERYVTTISYPSQADSFSIRVDQKITNSISLFGRYNQSPSSQTFRAFPSQNNFYKKHLHTFTLGSTQVFSSRVTNDFRFNYSHNDGLFDFRGIEVDGSVLPPRSLIFPSFTSPDRAAVSIQLSTGVASAGIISANLTQGKVTATKQRQFNFLNSVTLALGRHQLKFGIDYRRLKPKFNSREINISYVFSTTASRALGTPTSITVQAFAPNTNFYVENFSAYIQDAWRVSRRLTFSLGMRWEVNPPLQGERLPYNAIGMNNPLTATLAPKGTKQWKTRYDNLAPRLGVAYLLSEKHNLVIRSGFGIFYDLGTGVALRGFTSFPYNSLKTLTGSQLRFPADENDLRPPAFLDESPPPYFASFFFFDPNLRLPYTRQWNVSIEKGFGKDQTLTVSYVGAQGRRLIRTEQYRNFNAAFVQQRFGLNTGPLIVVNPAIFGPTPAQLQSNVPAAGSDVQYTRNGAESDYNALQIQYQRRLSKGLQVLASYTYSRSTDDVSDETTIGVPPNLLNLALEKGPSSFDLPHNFVAAISYDLPKVRLNGFLDGILNGWGVDSIIRWRSGLPFSVITQVFDPLNIGSTRRVDRVPGQPVWVKDKTRPGGRRLNPNAFALPPVGVQGNSGRNAYRSYNARQVDLAVRRTFKFLDDRLKVQLRAEAFNLFNTPNFGFPAASFGISGFGVPFATLGRTLSGNTAAVQTTPSPGFNSLYQMGGARSLQFAIKISY